MDIISKPAQSILSIDVSFVSELNNKLKAAMRCSRHSIYSIRNHKHTNNMNFDVLSQCVKHVWSSESTPNGIVTIPVSLRPIHLHYRTLFISISIVYKQNFVFTQCNVVLLSHFHVRKNVRVCLISMLSINLCYNTRATINTTPFDCRQKNIHIKWTEKATTNEHKIKWSNDKEIYAYVCKPVTHTDWPLCVLSWNLIVWNMKSNDTIETNAKWNGIPKFQCMESICMCLYLSVVLTFFRAKYATATRQTYEDFKLFDDFRFLHPFSLFVCLVIYTKFMWFFFITNDCVRSIGVLTNQVMIVIWCSSIG